MSENPDTTLAERPERSTDPLAMIALAVERGVDADQLGKLLALQERHERNLAESAYAAAITAFQADMPAVRKTRDVQERYRFASFDDIMRVAGPLLRKHGIVVTFDSAPMIDGAMPVVCKVRVGIHMEPTTVAVPPPGGNKSVNAAQLMAQTLSYGKRYALCAALNIVTTDEDTDAQYPPQQAELPAPVGNGRITTAQVCELDGLMEECKRATGRPIDGGRFIGWLNAHTQGDAALPHDLTEEQYRIGCAELRRKIAAAKGGAA